MATNPGSAALAGNPEPGASPAPGTTPAAETPPANTPAAKSWYEEAGIDPKFHDTVKAKDWKSPNDVLDSYTNIEKLVSMERGGEVDRIVVKPKADAPAEEIAAFRAKAGFAAPEDVKDYGFTPENIGSKTAGLFATAGLPADMAAPFAQQMAPILEQSAAWFKEAGVPSDVAAKLVDQVLGSEIAGLKEFNARSDKEYTDLGTEMGDKFGDFEEAGRRAARAAGLDAGMLDKLEMAIGTKSMMQMFGKLGSALTEAVAPQPGKTGGQSQFTQSSQQAVDRINTLSKDSDFQAKLISPNPEVRKAAQGEWEGLFKTAYPTA